MKLCMVVLNAQNPKRLIKFKQTFSSSGLSEFGSLHVHQGLISIANASAEEQGNCVYRNHYEITKTWANYCQKTHSHLLIMEDDCLFLKNVARQLNQTIRYLDVNFSFWHVLFLGHFPTKPMFAIKNGLVTSTRSYESHCYVLNYKFLIPMLQQVPVSYWKSPYFVEEWRSLPPYVCFAFYPSPVIQSVLPRFWKERNVSYSKYLSIHARCARMNYYITPIFSFGISRFLEKSWIQNAHQNYVKKNGIEYII